jgi:hypothetical protein
VGKEHGRLQETEQQIREASGAASNSISNDLCPSIFAEEIGRNVS